MPAPTTTPADYGAALQSLLPTGWAWPRGQVAVQSLLASGLAQLPARLHARANALLVDAFPATTGELLPEWEASLGLPDACSPNESFSRASEATYFDAAGVLQVAAPDTPRFAWNADGSRGAMLIEPAAVNAMPNARAEGAAAGTPGTAPTGWLVSPQAGISWQVVGAGTDPSGLPFVDVRLYGTTSGSGSSRIYLAGGPTTNRILATSGQTWTVSAYATLRSGSIAGLTPSLMIEGYQGTTFIGAETTLTAFALGSGPLASQRYSVTRTLNQAATDRFRTQFNFAAASGGIALDFVVRVGAPQAEQGAAPTSLILPPPGAPGAASRAADLHYVASTDVRRGHVLSRFAARGGQSVPYLVALAANLGYQITVTEYAPARAGLATAGAPAYGEAWAHALTINAPGQSLSYARARVARVGDPLASWGNSGLECAISRVRPAHSVTLYAYGG